MKVNIVKISTSLMMLLIGFSSCQEGITEKDQLLEEVQRKTGGKDTDSPIFVGLAIDTSDDPIYPAVIALHEGEAGVGLDSTSTDENGAFHFNLADTGYYHLRVYQNDELLGSSSTVHVTDSSYVVIQL